MKKLLVLLMAMGIGAATAFASGGVGVFGSFWDSDDLGPGYGGGVKFKAGLADYLALELRASCITKFDDWEDLDMDDDLFVIPLEAGLMLELPIGDSPLTVYGGGGGGYAIIPEADDVDIDDDFTLFGLGGVELALNESVSLFGEAQYRFLEVDDVELGGRGTGVEGKLSGFGVNAGVIFGW